VKDSRKRDYQNLSLPCGDDYTAPFADPIHEVSTPMRNAIWLAGAAVMLASLLASPDAPAQDKKDQKKTQPRVTVVIPLGMQPGAKATLSIRGTKLDTATEVRFADDAGEAKIKNKGKVEPPDKNPEKYGDTQVVVEVKLSDKAVAPVSFTVITPDGETKPHTLLVETSRPVIKEVEPNDDFRKPQSISEPSVVIEGSIASPLDIDVYAIRGKKGQKLRVESQAVRHGSAFDPHIALYRTGQLQIDAPPRRLSGDVAFEYELPRDDQYFIAVSDALDGGGAVHVYRLSIELK